MMIEAGFGVMFMVMEDGKIDRLQVRSKKHSVEHSLLELDEWM